jgi:hypothetical protein
VTECSNDDVLVAFITGSLDGRATADIRAHMEACRSCEAIVRAVAGDARSEQLLPAAVRAKPFVPAPPDVQIRYRDDVENARRHPASTLEPEAPHEPTRP